MSNNLTRLTVNLVVPANEALQSLMNRLKLSQTDIINRSLQVYDFIEQERGKGGEMVIRYEDGSAVQVRML